MKGDPLKILKGLIEKYSIQGDPRVPIVAGAFGYFAYDLGWQSKDVPSTAIDDLGLPDCYLGFYDRLIIWDNDKKKMFLTSTGLPEQGGKAIIRARERLAGLEDIVHTDGDDVESILEDELPGGGGERNAIRGHFTYESYCAAVQKVKDYIDDGDILQANLTQRFSCRLQEKPWQLYLRLREINPAPFAAYFHYPELDIVSASPERFVKVNDTYVETRPIKGTRPRGKNRHEDLRLRRELLESEKERAELSMITALVSKELGKVCIPGSVNVPEMFCLEEYPTVFHLVSTVRGELAADKNIVDLLLTAFPGGSITGTPKIRSMEIIEELEPVKRGIYTGSLGYLGFDGKADLSIVIRTIIIKDGIAYFQVGGGITRDSDPDAEYRETIDKAHALLEALGHSREVNICQVLPG